MSSGVERHVLERIRAAPVAEDPFPHCVIDEVFPAEFFEDIIDHWPALDAFIPIAETGRVKVPYEERRVLRVPEDIARLTEAQRELWSVGVASWLYTERFTRALVEKFNAPLRAAGALDSLTTLGASALLVSDRTRYAIGPHTDAPHRLVSLLFYLPEDASFRRFGTSFYAPLDPGFRCPGGPHHDFSGFRRVRTLDFVPNRLVMFPKSDRCFHGVEPVDLPGIERRLLIYDVRRA